MLTVSRTRQVLAACERQQLAESYQCCVQWAIINKGFAGCMALRANAGRAVDVAQILECACICFCVPMPISISTFLVCNARSVAHLHGNLLKQYACSDI